MPAGASHPPHSPTFYRTERLWAVPREQGGPHWESSTAPTHPDSGRHSRTSPSPSGSAPRGVTAPQLNAPQAGGQFPEFSPGWRDWTVGQALPRLLGCLSSAQAYGRPSAARSNPTPSTPPEKGYLLTTAPQRPQPAFFVSLPLPLLWGGEAHLVAGPGSTRSNAARAWVPAGRGPHTSQLPGRCSNY